MYPITEMPDHAQDYRCHMCHECINKVTPKRDPSSSLGDMGPLAAIRCGLAVGQTDALLDHMEGSLLVIDKTSIETGSAPIFTDAEASKIDNVCKPKEGFVRNG